MNEAQNDPQIKKAIEGGEVLVDEKNRTYQILVDTLGTIFPLREWDRAGDMLVRQKKVLGYRARLEHLGYKARPVNLDELKASLTYEQRIILSNIAVHFLDGRNDSDPWIRSGILYNRLGEGYDEHRVHTILKPLGGTVVYESKHSGSGKCYVLTPLGFLLTERGNEIEDILSQYLECITRQFVESDGRNKLVILSQVAEKVNFSDHQLGILKHIFGWFNSYFGGGSVENHGLPPCVDDLVTVKDFRSYIREREFSKFDQNVPTDQEPWLYKGNVTTNESLPPATQLNKLTKNSDELAGIEELTADYQAWVVKLTEENFLAIHDVVMDIQQELQLKDVAHIPAVNRLIKPGFEKLLPQGTPSLMDRYCQFRLNAISVLERKGIIESFDVYQDAHRWDATIVVEAKFEKIDAVAELMDQESIRRGLTSKKNIPESVLNEKLKKTLSLLQRRRSLISTVLAVLGTGIFGVSVNWLSDSNRETNTSFRIWGIVAGLVIVAAHWMVGRSLSYKMEDCLYIEKVRLLKKQIMFDSVAIALVIASLLYSFGVTNRIAAIIVSIYPAIGGKLSNTISTIFGWAVSGIVGNLVYDILKRIYMKKVNQIAETKAETADNSS